MSSGCAEKGCRDPQTASAEQSATPITVTPPHHPPVSRREESDGAMERGAMERGAMDPRPRKSEARKSGPRKSGTLQWRSPRGGAVRRREDRGERERGAANPHSPWEESGRYGDGRSVESAIPHIQPVFPPPFFWGGVHFGHDQETVVSSCIVSRSNLVWCFTCSLFVCSKNFLTASEYILRSARGSFTRVLNVCNPTTFFWQFICKTSTWDVHALLSVDALLPAHVPPAHVHRVIDDLGLGNDQHAIRSAVNAACGPAADGCGIKEARNTDIDLCQRI